MAVASAAILIRFGSRSRSWRVVMFDVDDVSLEVAVFVWDSFNLVRFLDER